MRRQRLERLQRLQRRWRGVGHLRAGHGAAALDLLRAVRALVHAVAAAAVPVLARHSLPVVMACGIPAASGARAAKSMPSARRLQQSTGCSGR